MLSSESCPLDLLLGTAFPLEGSFLGGSCDCCCTFEAGAGVGHPRGGRPYKERSSAHDAAAVTAAVLLSEALAFADIFTTDVVCTTGFTEEVEPLGTGVLAAAHCFRGTPYIAGSSVLPALAADRTGT